MGAGVGGDVGDEVVVVEVVVVVSGFVVGSADIEGDAVGCDVG